MKWTVHDTNGNSSREKGACMAAAAEFAKVDFFMSSNIQGF
jgi:hypothetical protein